MVSHASSALNTLRFPPAAWSMSIRKPELRPNKDFEAKYNKVKAKLALLSSSTSSKPSMVKNKGLVAEAYEWDEKDVSSDDTNMTEVKKRILGLDQLTEDLSSSKQTDLVFVKSSTKDIKVSISGIERPSFSKAGGFALPNHDTCRILPAKSQVTITNPSVAITDSSATEYDSANESLVCSTHLPLLEKIAASKRNSAPTGKLKNVNIEDDIPLVISLGRGIKPRNPKQVTKGCETCGSIVHTKTDHNDIEWFRRGEALQAKKAEVFQSKKTKSSNVKRSKTPTKR
ncbi:hypothetical protein Tco_0807452 [Tanacetum coccineum]